MNAQRVPKGIQMGESKRDRTGSLEASWSALASCRPLGTLWEASWTPLGGLRALKIKVGIGSWPAQGHQGDWFPIV